MLLPYHRGDRIRKPKGGLVFFVVSVNGKKDRLRLADPEFRRTNSRGEKVPLKFNVSIRDALKAGYKAEGGNCEEDQEEVQQVDPRDCGVQQQALFSI